MVSIFAKIHQRFATWPNEVLSGSLILAAVLIICIALLPDHMLLKALILAYVVLP